MTDSKGAPAERGASAEVLSFRPSDSQRIRDLMSWGGMSEQDAVRELGIDADSLRDWRSGRTAPPRMAILALERLIEKQRRLDSWL